MKRNRSLVWMVVLVLVLLPLLIACEQPAAPSATAAPAVKPAATQAPAASGAAAGAPAAKPATGSVTLPPVIKVGGLLPMTGTSAAAGRYMQRGAELAVEQINAKGGFEGSKLELVIEDNKSGQAKEGAAGMKKIVEIDKSLYVLTSFSGVTLAAQPIALENKVLLMNGGGWSPDLIGKPYLFNNRVMGTYLGQAIVEYAFKDLGLKKLAMLYISDASGIGTGDYVQPIFEKLGGKVVAREMHEVGATDFTTQLSKIKQAGPDVLATWSTGKDVGLMQKQSRELGLTMPWIGINIDPEGIKVGAGAVNGYRFTSDGFDMDGKEAITQDFVKSYKAKYNEDPDYRAANYYDAVLLFVELLKGAKAKGGNWYNGEALQQVLITQKAFPTVYGGQQIFREDGTATKPLTLFEVKGDQPVKLKSLELK